MNSIAAPRVIDSAEAPIHLSNYRRDIDGLRAVAVMAVLVFHAFPSYLPGGFVGVDIFFVISGFLITKVILSGLERGSFSLGDFYARRVRRIFPALLVVLAACLAFGWKTMLAEDLTHLAKHVFGGATFSSNLLLWGETGYFDKASESKPLLHLWSLGIEEQFYVVWPLLVWATWRRGTSPAVLIGTTALASFLLNVAGVVHHQTATFYSPLSRAWELLLGAGLAQLGGSLRASQGQRTVASLLGFGLIVFAVFGLAPGTHFPGWWALLPVLGTCLIIWAGTDGWVNRAVLARPAMVGIGLISFPLYLWHWPLLTLGNDLVPSGAWGKAVLLLISIGLAWTTYAVVERPFRYGGNARCKVAVLAALMLLVGSAAATVFMKSGVPSRYPEIIQNATKFDLDGFRESIRWRKCFIEFEQEMAEFPAECVDQASSKPLVMLWGDSGAASLYRGLRLLADRTERFRLAQFTSSACPPLLGFETSRRPACRPNNLRTFELARKLKPEVAMLTAVWQYYYDPAQLSATIKALHEIGISRVVVLGPAPTWKDAPGRIVLKLWQEDPLHRVPSPRLNYGRFGLFETGDDAAPRGALVDAKLGKAAAEAGATYISLLDTMCNEAGCLMRASNASGESFYLDSWHLNPEGSEFLVNVIAPQLISVIGK